MKNSSESGFSLVQILISIGLMGALSLYLLKLTDNMNYISKSADANSEENELRHEIRMILDNPKHCSVSFLTTPTSATYVSFKKQDIDQFDRGEGLPLDLFLTPTTGAPAVRFSSTNPGLNRTKKITIKSIKLVMDNGTGQNYPQSINASDVGRIIVTLQKNKNGDKHIEFPIVVTMNTDGSGNSTPFLCRSKAENDPCPALGMILDSMTNKCRYPITTRAAQTRPANWDFPAGNWGAWAYCPDNTRVVGLQLYGEPDQGTGNDDTSLNGIRFICGFNAFGIIGMNKIESARGPFGAWESDNFCPFGSYAIGFDHLQESYRGSSIDDTATNGLKLICSDQRRTMIGGQFTNYGGWNRAMCPGGQYLCGLITKVEGNQHGNDDTGLGGIQAQCCTVENEPALSPSW